MASTAKPKSTGRHSFVPGLRGTDLKEVVDSARKKEPSNSDRPFNG